MSNSRVRLKSGRVALSSTKSKARCPLSSTGWGPYLSRRVSWQVEVQTRLGDIVRGWNHGLMLAQCSKQGLHTSTLNQGLHTSTLNHTQTVTQSSPDHTTKNPPAHPKHPPSTPLFHAKTGLHDVIIVHCWHRSQLARHGHSDYARPKPFTMYSHARHLQHIRSTHLPVLEDLEVAADEVVREPLCPVMLVGR